MNILLCLLFIVLVIVTTGYHAYFVWKRKDRKTLGVQIGIVVITIVAGIFAISMSEPSISKLLDIVSPFAK